MDCDDRRLAARPALIMASGHMGSADMWSAQIAGLSDHAAITVADLTLDSSIAAMADRILRDAPDRFAFAGFSLGGFVAFELMRRAPERVQRLAIISSSARPDSTDRAAGRRSEIEGAKHGRLAAQIDDWLPTLVSQGHPQAADVVAHLGDKARTIGPDGYVRQQTAMLNRPDARPHLAAISCPTVVISGREDVITICEVNREIAARIPGAEFILFDRCGHIVPLEQPDALTRLLRDWVASQQDAASERHAP